MAYEGIVICIVHHSIAHLNLFIHICRYDFVLKLNLTIVHANLIVPPIDFLFLEIEGI